jgi:hypothetical protein
MSAAKVCLYRANFSDGTWSKSYPDIRDARAAKWSRAAIVQYRTSIEQATETGWIVLEPSRASRNGPPIIEQTEGFSNE